MEKPKYIAVVIDNKRLSHMSLWDGGYTTKGWTLPKEHIKWSKRYECFIIVGFMEHLDNARLEPISEVIFKKDEWGIETKLKAE